MPDDPSNPPLDPRQRVKMGTQLWSTQVGMVEASKGDGACRKDDYPVYQFSNGRKFIDRTDPYETFPDGVQP